MAGGTEVTRRGWLLFVSLCVIWGIPYLLIRVAVRDMSPVVVVFGRCSIAALLLLPLAIARGQVRPVVRRWRPLVAFTAVEIALPWLLLARAEQHLTSSLTGLLIAAVPLTGALLTWMMGDREPLSAQNGLGLALGFVGVAALVGFDLGGIRALPLVEIALVVVGYALGPILLSRYLSDLPDLGVIAVALAATTVIYAPLAALDPPAATPSWKAIVSVVVLAVVCTALAFLVFFALITELGPVRALVVTYVNPAVAALLGVTLLGESFTGGMALGFVLILAGSVLATKPSLRAAGARLEPQPASRAP
jgi:drug/metabolite transporter (DMT)-like permease